MMDSDHATKETGESKPETSEGQVLAAYPDLTRDDVLAAVEYEGRHT